MPDPIPIPGSMDIYLKTAIDTDLVSPVELELQMEYHMGVFWAKVPCRGNVGSCKYDDLCQFIGRPPQVPCPPSFNSSNVPCRCPIPAVSTKSTNAYLTVP
jgi:ganglioside GM2 activator